MTTEKQARAPQNGACLGFVVQSCGRYLFTSAISPVSATTVDIERSASSWLANVALLEVLLEGSLWAGLSGRYATGRSATRVRRPTRLRLLQLRAAERRGHRRSIAWTGRVCGPCAGWKGGSLLSPRMRHDG
jgi:hypothetical protein